MGPAPSSIRLATAAWGIVCLPAWIAAQTATELKLKTGKQIYEAACAACHGVDGKGQPQSTLGFEPPATFPDFSDCGSSSREPDSHWSANGRLAPRTPSPGSAEFAAPAHSA